MACSTVNEPGRWRGENCWKLARWWATIACAGTTTAEMPLRQFGRDAPQRQSGPAKCLLGKSANKVAGKLPSCGSGHETCNFTATRAASKKGRRLTSSAAIAQTGSGLRKAVVSVALAPKGGQVSGNLSADLRRHAMTKIAFLLTFLASRSFSYRPPRPQNSNVRPLSSPARPQNLRKSRACFPTAKQWPMLAGSTRLSIFCGGKACQKVRS